MALQTFLLALFLATAAWAQECDIDFTLTNWNGIIQEHTLYNFTINATGSDLSSYSWTVLTTPRRLRRTSVSLVKYESSEIAVRFDDFQYSDFANTAFVNTSVEITAFMDDCETSRRFPFTVASNPPRITSSDKIYISPVHLGYFHAITTDPTEIELDETGWVSFDAPKNVILDNTTGHLSLDVTLDYSDTPYMFTLEANTTNGFTLRQLIFLYVFDAYTDRELPNLRFWTDDIIRVKEHETDIELQVNTFHVQLTVLEADFDLGYRHAEYNVLTFAPFRGGVHGNITVNATTDDESKSITKIFHVYVENLLDPPIWQHKYEHGRLNTKITKMTTTRTEIIPANSIIPTPSAWSPEAAPITYYMTTVPYQMCGMFQVDNSTGEVTCTKALQPGEYNLILTAETYPVGTDVWIVITISPPPPPESSNNHTNDLKHLLWLIPLLPVSVVVIYACYRRQHRRKSKNIRATKTVYVDRKKTTAPPPKPPRPNIHTSAAIDIPDEAAESCLSVET